MNIDILSPLYVTECGLWNLLLFYMFYVHTLPHSTLPSLG